MSALRWILLLGTPFCTVFLTCCSEVPPLSSEPGRGPSVRQVVNHIDCELASIIASNPSTKPSFTPLTYYGPIDPVIVEREAFDSRLKGLLPYLQENHFVASALLTLDTSDTEGIFPSATFIHPFTTSFSQAIGLGGQLSGSQERNVTVGYSIDLANVGDGCFPREVMEPEVGLNGNLRLGDIIADGLTALDATNGVNVYSAGGPTRPAFDATLDQMPLGFSCSSSGSITDACKQYKGKFDLAFSGNLGFAPASDPQLPGTLSFSGSATGGGERYVMSLTGSTIEVGVNKNSELKFTLSGTMMRVATGQSDIAASVGFSPSISLVGTVAYSKHLVTGLKDVTGQLTPSSELSPPTGTKITFNVGGPGDKQAGAIIFPDRAVKFSPNQLSTNFTISSASTSSATGGAGSATAKSSAASSASSTQFGSFVTFMISYGINGGPNWTLSTFKGPGGGSGTNGQLLAATRTHTASLQMTFVAACNDNNNFQSINTFWQSIPKCNGTQQAQAAAIGQSLNYLAASGRGTL